MNKAAFLDILHHVSDITDQEVSELEKLALNFPYCQSAHLLLAKAAYDRGSMLSNQRLRRAAACATNRQLLKKLIYTAGPDIVLAPIATSLDKAEELPSAPEEISPALMPDVEVVEDAASIVSEQDVEISEITEPISKPENEEIKVTALKDEEDTIEPVEVTPVLEEEVIKEISPLLLPETGVDLIHEPELMAGILPDYTDEYDALFAVEHLNTALPQADPVTAFLTNEPEADLNSETEDNNALPGSDFEATATDITSDSEIALAEELLARQDPVDDEVRTEPVLSSSLPQPDTSTDDTTLTRFDSYLFTPEKDVVPEVASTPSKSYEEEILYKVFDANELGYWMESSRLGETLLLKDELATAQPYYFSPELFLEYSHHHELGTYEAPPTSILTRQIDIIDQFLKLNPKLKSMAHLKVKAEPQEDLSSRSTKIKRNLASENLANILIQQGKIKKAIKIYEHLILKIPEKKAYFASQIEKLHNLT